MGNILKKKLLPCLKDNYSSFMSISGCCVPGMGMFIYSICNIAANIFFTCGDYWGIAGVFLYVLYAVATVPTKSFPPPDAAAIMLRIGNILYLVVLVLDSAWLIDHAIWFDKYCGHHYNCSSWENWNMAAAVIRICVDYILAFFIMSSAESAARAVTGFF